MSVARSLQIAEKMFSVTIRPRRGMRRLILRVCGSRELLVKCPLRVGWARIESFLLGQREWILLHAAAAEKAYAAPSSFPLKIRLLGEEFPVQVVHAAGVSSTVQMENTVFVYLRSGSGDGVARQLLERFRLGVLESLLADLITKWSARMQVNVTSFKIVRQMRPSGYLGKCFVNEKKIHFKNWLVELTSDEVEYIVVHELCHLIEPSHSVEFKRLLTHFLPEWKGLHLRVTKLLK